MESDAVLELVCAWAMELALVRRLAWAMVWEAPLALVSAVRSERESAEAARPG